MGASTSSEDNTTAAAVEGLSLEGLIAEANRALVRASEIITQTVESEVGDAMSDLQERAATKLNETFATFQEKLGELSRRSEEAEACVRAKETELNAIRAKMKDAIEECYGKHKTALEKLRPDRAIIHTEAKQFKLEAQRIIENCMSNRENRLECFRAAIVELAAKADALRKKFEALVKREAEMRAKTAKQILDCDKRNVDEASKRLDRVIEEIKKCDRKVADKSS